MKTIIMVRKVSFLVSIAALAFLSGCKKEKPANINQTPSGTIVLSKIIDNTPADGPLYGQTLCEFIYTGKKLTKAIQYDDSVDFQTDVFNYDSQGNLTGTTISYTARGVLYQSGYNEDVGSAITINGGNITEIKFYQAGNVLDQDIVLTWQNGNLVNWKNTTYNTQNNIMIGTQPGIEGIAYQYDSNNNNTTQTSENYSVSGQITSGYTITNTSFDSKKNVTLALPLWTYLSVNRSWFSYIPTIPGTNNPLADNDSTTYTYQYDSNGYPTLMSLTYPNAANGNYNPSYKFVYTQVN